jgi:hypothetical protein
MTVKPRTANPTRYTGPSAGQQRAHSGRAHRGQNDGRVGGDDGGDGALGVGQARRVGQQDEPEAGCQGQYGQPGNRPRQHGRPPAPRCRPGGTGHRRRPRAVQHTTGTATSRRRVACQCGRPASQQRYGS